MILINKINSMNYTFKSEMTLVGSLIPFSYTVFYSDYVEIQCISALIIVNGCLCHTTLAFSCKYKNVFLYYDVISNIIFTTYITLTTLWQPYTFIISATMCTTYIINKINELNIGRYNWLAIITHIIFIQWFGFLGVLYYSKQV